MSKIQDVLRIQEKHQLLVSDLTQGLNTQFDFLVDIKLLELEFQDRETFDLNELELGILQTDLLFDRLMRVEQDIVFLQSNLELMEQKLERV